MDVCLTVLKSAFSFADEKDMPWKSHPRARSEKGMKIKDGSSQTDPTGVGGGVRKRPTLGQTGRLKMCSI